MLPTATSLRSSSTAVHTTAISSFHPQIQSASPQSSLTCNPRLNDEAIAFVVTLRATKVRLLNGLLCNFASTANPSTSAYHLPNFTAHQAVRQGSRSPLYFWRQVQIHLMIRQTKDVPPTPRMEMRSNILPLKAASAGWSIHFFQISRVLRHSLQISQPSRLKI